MRLNHATAPHQDVAKTRARAKALSHPKANPKGVPKGDRLLTPMEVERAVQDQVLLPTQVLPLSAVLKLLLAHVEDEGGVMRFARASGSTPSVISDALNGRRGGIGRAAAKHLGLQPTVLRVMAYKVVQPRRAYRLRPDLLSKLPKTVPIELQPPDRPPR